MSGGATKVVFSRIADLTRTCHSLLRLLEDPPPDAPVGVFDCDADGFRSRKHPPPAPDCAFESGYSARVDAPWSRVRCPLSHHLPCRLLCSGRNFFALDRAAGGGLDEQFFRATTGG